MGRSDRVNPEDTLVGAFITSDKFMTIDAIKQGCEYEEKKVKTI